MALSQVVWLALKERVAWLFGCYAPRDWESHAIELDRSFRLYVDLKKSDCMRYQEVMERREIGPEDPEAMWQRALLQAEWVTDISGFEYCEAFDDDHRPEIRRYVRLRGTEISVCRECMQQHGMQELVDRVRQNQ